MLLVKCFRSVDELVWLENYFSFQFEEVARRGSGNVAAAKEKRTYRSIMDNNSLFLPYAVGS